MSKALKYLLLVWFVQVILVLVYLDGVAAPGVPFDDAWIHFVIARNIAGHGVVSFNVGSWSGGTTSLLWDMLLALGFRLTHRMLLVSHILGVLGFLGLGAAFYLIVSHSLADRPYRFEAASFAAVVLSLTGFLPYLALSGMDTLLFLSLALGSIAAFVYRRHWLAGWLLSALMLTRIEAIGVLAVIAVAAIWRRAILHERGASAYWLLLPVLSLASYLSFNLLTTGTLLPSTMSGRKWLWGFPPTGGVFSLDRTARYVRDWRFLLSDFVFGSSSRLSLAAVILLALLGLAYLVSALVQKKRSTVTVGFCLVGWVVGHNLTYLIMAPIASWRHQISNVIVLPWFMALGAAALLDRWGHRSRWIAWGLGLLVVGAYLPGTIAYRSVYAGNVNHINTVHVAAGRWVDSHLPADAVVAAFDIGGVKYFGNRTVLDLGGLTEADFAERYLYPETVPQYLFEMGASYLVMPEPAAIGQTDLKDRLGIHMDESTSVKGPVLTYVELTSFETPPYIDAPFDSLPYQFYPAYRKVTVYEIQSRP